MIKNKIHLIRDKQVILDKDLAELYEVDTKVLNQTVKRNKERFPEDFMFQLTKKETISLRSHIVTTKKGGRRYLPYAFTEHGITALSGILKSKKAIEINIQIIRAFISMRKLISQNSNIFQKFQQIDQKLIEHDHKFSKLFNSMKIEKPKQRIFFNGEIFDAYKFINNLIKTAKNEILLIDNYIDYTTLSLFCNSKSKVIIYTKNISDKLKLDLS